MVAKATTIRNAVHSKIEEDRDTYVITTFDLHETFYPRESIEDLKERPAIKVVSMANSSSRDRNLRNPEKLLLQLPVQINVQQKVNPTDTKQIDTLLELMEQIQNSLEDDDLVTDEDYSWMSTDPLRDENGLVFSYEQLTVQNVFNGIFTVTYQTFKQ